MGAPRGGGAAAAPGAAGGLCLCTGCGCNDWHRRASLPRLEQVSRRLTPRFLVCLAALAEAGGLLLAGCAHRLSGSALRLHPRENALLYPPRCRQRSSSGQRALLLYKASWWRARAAASRWFPATAASARVWADGWCRLTTGVCCGYHTPHRLSGLRRDFAMISRSFSFIMDSHRSASAVLHCGLAKLCVQS